MTTPDHDIAAALAATVVLHPDDAGELAEALRHAGTLLEQLAGAPAAEAAHRELAGPGAPDLAAFALDLLVHAAELSDPADAEDPPP